MSPLPIPRLISDVLSLIASHLVDLSDLYHFRLVCVDWDKSVRENSQKLLEQRNWRTPVTYEQVCQAYVACWIAIDKYDLSRWVNVYRDGQCMRYTGKYRTKPIWLDTFRTDPKRGLWIELEVRGNHNATITLYKNRREGDSLLINGQILDYTLDRVLTFFDPRDYYGGRRWQVSKAPAFSVKEFRELHRSLYIGNPAAALDGFVQHITEQFKPCRPPMQLQQSLEELRSIYNPS